MHSVQKLNPNNCNCCLPIGSLQLHTNPNWSILSADTVTNIEDVDIFILRMVSINNLSSATNFVVISSFAIEPGYGAEFVVPFSSHSRSLTLKLS